MAKRIQVGGRIESKEVGGIVTGAAEILDDAKGKKQSVINGETDDELLRLDQSKQDNLTFDNAPTEGSDNPVKSGGVYAADKALSDAIEAILLLIPSAASALNKLVDTAMMNSSISTATATFRGTYNVVTDLSLTIDATHEQIAATLGNAISTADNNDYAFVQIPVSEESTDIRRTERYKFNGTAWGYEYDLNTSGFTAAQWAAINSGITLALVGKLIGLPTSSELQALLGQKQDTLTFDNVPTAGSANPVKSGGVYSEINDEKTAREQLANTVTGIDGRVEGIEEVIPTGAAANNKLVANNSMEAYVTSIIEAITASFTIATGDGHINLTLTQTNGRVASLTLTTSDIASAQALTALTGRVSTAEGNITSLGGRVSTNENDIAALKALYNALQQSAPQVVEPSDPWPVSNPSTTVIYRVIDRVNTPPQYYSDYMWNGTIWVLMATYNNAIDDEPTIGSNNLVKSGGVASKVYSETGIEWTPYKEGNINDDGSLTIVGEFVPGSNSTLVKINIKEGEYQKIHATLGSVNANFKAIAFYHGDQYISSIDLKAKDNNIYDYDAFIPNYADTIYVYNRLSNCANPSVSIATPLVDAFCGQTSFGDLSNVPLISGYTVGETQWEVMSGAASAIIQVPDNAVGLQIEPCINTLGLYFLKSNTPPTTSMTPDLCGGEIGRRVASVNKSSYYTLPSDCKYIGIVLMYGNKNVRPQIFRWYHTKSKEHSIEIFEGNEVYPLDFGAHYDGVSDCTSAIQQAVNSANGKIVKLSGNGVAIISKPIYLSSNCHIKIDHGFTLKLADGSNCPMFKNAKANIPIDDPSAGSSYDQNITIEGGILDFNGDNQTFDNQVYTNSVGILLADVEYFTLRDITLKNPTTFSTHLNNIKWFTIENIFLDYNNSHNNMDGIHLNGGCCYGTIENVYGTTNDDMIALNPGDVKFRYATIRIGAMHDIVVSNIKAVNGWRAIRLLSSVESPMYNIKISDIYGTYRHGVILFSTYYDMVEGQEVSRDAIYKDIVINNVNCKCSTEPIIWFQSNYEGMGSQIISSGLVLNGVSYHYASDNKMGFLQLDTLTQINDLEISELNLTTDDIDLSSVKLISGAGTVEKLIMNNINIEKPATQSKMKGIEITPSVLLVSNAIIDLDSKYSANILGESNVVYNGSLLE